jgi:hypothetical protein
MARSARLNSVSAPSPSPGWRATPMLAETRTPRGSGKNGASTASMTRDSRSSYPFLPPGSRRSRTNSSPPHPGHRILRAHAAEKTPGDLLEKTVPGLVPQGVVEGLEAVQVQIADGRDPPVPGGPVQETAHPLLQEGPIGQPREGVEPGHMLQGPGIGPAQQEHPRPEGRQEAEGEPQHPLQGDSPGCPHPPRGATSSVQAQWATSRGISTGSGRGIPPPAIKVWRRPVSGWVLQTT